MLASAAYHYFAEQGGEGFPTVAQLEAALPAIMAAANTDDTVAVAWLKAEVGARQPDGLCHNATEPPPPPGDHHGGPGDTGGGGDQGGNQGNDDSGDTSAGGDQNGDVPGWDGIPHGGFRRPFLNRVWRFVGEDPILNDSGDVLDVTLLRVSNLPRKFRNQDNELIDQDLLVKLGQHVKLRDCAGNKVTPADLEDYTDVSGRGKLLRPTRWLQDADGETTPTVRAKYVREYCAA